MGFFGIFFQSRDFYPLDLGFFLISGFSFSGFSRNPRDSGFFTFGISRGFFILGIVIFFSWDGISRQNTTRESRGSGWTTPHFKYMVSGPELPGSREIGPECNSRQGSARVPCQSLIPQILNLSPSLSPGF